MLTKIFKKCLIPILSLFLVSCSSQSSKTVSALDKTNPAFKSEKCATALQTANKHEEIKRTRTFGSPLLVVLSGGVLALPVLASNIGMDVADNLNASDISVSCGGKAKSVKEIAANVGRGAAFGLAVGDVSPASSSMNE